MATEQAHERSIEDRLLVMETRLGYLATKAELTEQIAKLRDDMRVWYFAGWSSMILLIVGATVVNHYWK